MNKPPTLFNLPTITRASAVSATESYMMVPTKCVVPGCMIPGTANLLVIATTYKQARSRAVVINAADSKYSARYYHMHKFLLAYESDED